MLSLAWRSGGNVSRAQERAAEAMMCVGEICAGRELERHGLRQHGHDLHGNGKEKRGCDLHSSGIAW